MRHRIVKEDWQAVGIHSKVIAMYELSILLTGLVLLFVVIFRERCGERFGYIRGRMEWLKECNFMSVAFLIGFGSELAVFLLW